VVVERADALRHGPVEPPNTLDVVRLHISDFSQRSPAAQPVTPTVRSTSTLEKGWSRYCG
jgi:hypothetical protein